MANDVDNNKQLFWADIVRVFAIIGVITIHVAAFYFYKNNSLSTSRWLTAEIFDSVSRISVPLFIMLSGALLLGKQESRKAFIYSRLFKKLVIPLIAWSIIYFIWRIRFSNIQFETALSSLLHGSISYHLIFFNYFIGLYLLIPILRKYIRTATLSDNIYLLILWFIFTGFIPLVSLITNIKLPLSLPEMTGYFGYMIAGYALMNANLNKKLTILSLLLFILSNAVTIIGTYVSTKLSGYPNETLFVYTAPNVIIAALSGFLLLRRCGEWIENRVSSSTKSFLYSLSKLSFGIYLMHVIWLEIFTYYIDISRYHPLVAIPLLVFLVGAISMICTYLIKKIPILKYIIP